MVFMDRFPFKTLNGNILNASEVFPIFKSYIVTVNSKAANRSATLKSAPEKPIKSTVNEAPNVLPTQLDAVYEKALEEAKKSFEAEQMVLELAIGDGLGQYKTSMDNLLLSSSM